MTIFGAGKLPAAPIKRAPPPAQSRSVPTSARPVVAVGNIIVLLFFGVLGGWAALAPMSSAVIAPGTIRVEGNNKTVQHLDGGLIKEILVREGDFVEAGQVLLRLQDLQPRANLQLLKSQYYSLQAVTARLVAERDGADRLRLPAELADRKDDPELAQVMAAQTALFEGRKRTLEGQTLVLKQRIAQLREQMRGAEVQQRSQDQQLQLIQEELKGAEYLFDQGYAPRTRVLSLQRSAAQLVGQKGEYGATIARLQQSIGETDLQMLQLQKERLTEVNSQLSDAQDKLVAAFERVRAAEDMLTRTEIKAPIAGYVLNLTAHTVGGVIDRSQRILDVVPQDTRKIIEAMVRPEDVKDVHEGMTAEVKLTAYKLHEVKPVHGIVTQVSADRQVTQAEPRGHYTIQLELNDEWKDIPGVVLVPGMPVLVTVPTKERTTLEYLLGPMIDYFGSAGRER